MSRRHCGIDRRHLPETSRKQNSLTAGTPAIALPLAIRVRVDPRDDEFCRFLSDKFDSTFNETTIRRRRHGDQCGTGRSVVEPREGLGCVLVENVLRPASATGRSDIACTT